MAEALPALEQTSPLPIHDLHVRLRKHPDDSLRLQGVRSTFRHTRIVRGLNVPAVSMLPPFPVACQPTIVSMNPTENPIQNPGETHARNLSEKE